MIYVRWGPFTFGLALDYYWTRVIMVPPCGRAVLGWPAYEAAMYYQRRGAKAQWYG